jgi:hypothetical protein
MWLVLAGHSTHRLLVRVDVLPNEKGPMKNFLLLAALAEGATGVLLFLWPVLVVRLLLGVEVSGIAIVMSRICGISLVGLGAACWPSNSSFQPLNGMLTYSTLAMLYLSYIGIRGEFAGLLLWPAVVAHGILVVLLALVRFRQENPVGIEAKD